MTLCTYNITLMLLFDVSVCMAVNGGLTGVMESLVGYSVVTLVQFAGILGDISHE